MKIKALFIPTHQNTKLPTPTLDSINEYLQEENKIVFYSSWTHSLDDWNTWWVINSVVWCMGINILSFISSKVSNILSITRKLKDYRFESLSRILVAYFHMDFNRNLRQLKNLSVWTNRIAYGMNLNRN